MNRKSNIINQHIKCRQCKRTSSGVKSWLYILSTQFADVKNHSYESVGPKFQNSPIPQGEESVSNQDTLLFPRALKMIKINLRQLL